MYAMHSPYGSPVMSMHGGGGGGGGGGEMAVLELQQLKSAPMLNPHFGMVEKYIDCLNRLMEPLVASYGTEGCRQWLIEVQTFTRMLQKRIFQAMPLMPHERQAVLNFVTYWRNSANPMFGMGSPEAQLVLIALTESASY